MPVLRVIHGEATDSISFTGRQKLSDVLAAHGYSIAHPCGGHGTCGKCAVRLSGDAAPMNELEIRAGSRLSCQAVLWGDCEVVLPETFEMQQIAVEGYAADSICMDEPAGNRGTVGAAVDIGTTTLALCLLALDDGRELATAAMLNPQTAVAADVMGRIYAAMHGAKALLQKQVTDAIGTMLADACKQADIAEEAVQRMVVTGNTTMLYLLTGRDPIPLSHAPFEADCLFDETFEILGIPAYLPPCMNAFVGADITCAALASGLIQTQDVRLLCDIGTNGEIALWKDGTLYVTSTAAGPAFEGAGIKMGVGSVRGAIDSVWMNGDMLTAHTIGNEPAVGICGSGLIDAIAVFLKTGAIDETGALTKQTLELRDGVHLVAADIRNIQLAKAAISAGIITVLHNADTRPAEVKTLYIAGGFGSHINLQNAEAIGLLPDALADCAATIGNAALMGAAILLLRPRERQEAQRIAGLSRHVNLAGNPYFNTVYVDRMMFE